MANIIFAGDAPEVAQVVTITVSAYDAATTYAVIMNGKTVSVVGSGGTTTTVATALAAALVASTIPEFFEVTWTSNAAIITGTAKTAGIPFTCTTSETGGTGTIDDPSTTTTADGPECVTALNFKDASTGVRGLPVDADVLYFQDTSVNLKYFLDALTGVTPAATYIRASYTGEIGLPAMNEEGDTYNEYRERFFTLDGSTILDIGYGDGDGSPRLNINLKAVQSAVTLWLTGDSAEDDYHALVIKGTNASNTLTAHGGTVDIAAFDDDTATFVTILASGDAVVRASAATTHTTITATGESEATYAAALTTLNINDEAEVTRVGTGTLTTGNVNHGTLNDWGSGTVSQMNVGGTGAKVDVSDSPVAKTWTNTTVAPGYEIDDSGRKVTFSNAISPGAGSVLDGTLKLGNGRTLLPGAP